jgi:hypothetical protein
MEVVQKYTVDFHQVLEKFNFLATMANIYQLP